MFRNIYSWENYILNSLNRIIIPVWMISGVGFIVYFIYIDSMALVVPGIFPASGSNHVYLHIHQLLIFTISSITFLIVDSTLMTIGFYFMAIFNIFRDMIKYLDNSGVNAIKQYLIDMQEFHLDILNKFQLFDEIFFYALAVQLATSVVFILVIFFLLRTAGLLFVPLFVTVSGQFFAVCLFGQLIFSKTEIFFTELYLTKWYEFNIREQKMLLIMMYVAQRPFGLRAAGMYDINLIMFIQIIKAGISFCAILYTFK